MADTQAALIPGTPERPDNRSGLANMDPSDRTARMVQLLVNESVAEQRVIERNHRAALMNSMAAREWDTYIDGSDIYGLGNATSLNRPISDIKSLFTAEQVNSITTQLVQPLLQQRELIFIEPKSLEEKRAAAVRAALFDYALRSEINPMGEIFWKVMRDVSVRSRGYIEVRHVKIERWRTVYNYVNLLEALGDAWAQAATELGLDPNEPLREASYEKVTVYDGPVFVPIPTDCVHKDRSANVTSHRRFQVIEREMPFEEACELGEKLFPGGTADEGDAGEETDQEPDENVASAGEQEIADIPFDADVLRMSMSSAVRVKRRDSTELTFPNEAAERLHVLPDEFEPVTIYEFRGIDPYEDPCVEWLAWVVNGKCVGRDRWRGSGPCMNLVEFMWDPMNGYTNSASPAMLLLREQEKLDLLGSCELDGAEYATHPSGAVNTDAVRSIQEVRQLRPADLIEKTSSESIFEEIQVGRYSEVIPEVITRSEGAARLATGGNTAIIGGAQPGVDTATEFAGISRGAMTRIGIQSEINFDGAVRALYELSEADFRDNIESDQALQEIVGTGSDVVGAQLQDLDGAMKVTVMGPRYHAVNQAEVQAINQLLQTLTQNPEYMDLVYPDEIIKDLSLAITRRSIRWMRPPQEVEQIRAQRAQQQAQDAAMQNQKQIGPGASGKPNGAAAGGPPAGIASPPAPVPTTPADLMPVMG